MNSIYVIGDALLAKCNEQAIKDDKCLNFAEQNVQCTWETNLQQTKAVEEKYKSLFSKKGKPNVVVILCGSYDLLLNNNPKDVSEKIRKLTQHILSTGVKHIIVCSLIDRYEDKVPCEINKFVKSTNRLMAKNYKDNEHIYFLNIRPPGITNDLWDSDHTNLKCEGYSHIYERLKTGIQKSVIQKLDPVTEDAVSPTSTVINPKRNIKEESVEPVASITITGGAPIAKRMMEFKDVLITDYKRICTEENQLTTKFNEIQKKLEETQQQKKELESTYEKLFNIPISLP